MSRRTIYVYVDDGADPFCAACLMRALHDVHGHAEMIDAPDLLAGGWEQTCDALAFPGGADRPYAEKLDGRGNQLIRDYVEDGGRFLGVCAGAYYACRRIDFLGEDLSLKKDRELGFFPGTAVGSLGELAAPYRVHDLRCAAAVELGTPLGPATVLYWGGCRFQPDPNPLAAEVLARYTALPPGRDIAAVRTHVGRGRAVLVGVHAEIRGEDFDRHRHEYPDPDARHVRETVAALYEGDADRSQFFSELVQALFSPADTATVAQIRSSP